MDFLKEAIGLSLEEMSRAVEDKWPIHRVAITQYMTAHKNDNEKGI